MTDQKNKNRAYTQTNAWFNDGDVHIVVSDYVCMTPDIIMTTAMCELRCTGRHNPILLLNRDSDKKIIAKIDSEILIGADNNTLIDLPKKLRLPHRPNIKNDQKHLTCFNIWMANFGRALIMKIAEECGMGDIFNRPPKSPIPTINYLMSSVKMLNYERNRGVFSTNPIVHYWRYVKDPAIKYSIFRETVNAEKAAIRQTIVIRLANMIANDIAIASI